MKLLETLGKELLTKTLIAMLLSAGGITLYVAYRFSELKYGVCAVLAMLHDSLVLLGIFSLFGKFMGVQVDTLFVTAVLTILSFSVHDTIVVYDRIRELRKKSLGLSFDDVINTAVTETMSRSINNSMAIIFMLFVLWLGDSMKWFVLALLIERYRTYYVYRGAVVGSGVNGERRSRVSAKDAQSSFFKVIQADINEIIDT